MRHGEEDVVGEVKGVGSRAGSVGGMVLTFCILLFHKAFFICIFALDNIVYVALDNTGTLDNIYIKFAALQIRLRLCRPRRGV